MQKRDKHNSIVAGESCSLTLALNPFEWTAVEETGFAFYVLDVSALANDVDSKEATVLRKPPSSPTLAAAQKTETAKIFLNFARFPFAIVYAEEDGFRVFIRDLRFARPGSTDWDFVVEVDLDRSLRVKNQTFRFSMKKPLY